MVSICLTWFASIWTSLMTDSIVFRAVSVFWTRFAASITGSWQLVPTGAATTASATPIPANASPWAARARPSLIAELTGQRSRAPSPTTHRKIVPSVQTIRASVAISISSPPCEPVPGLSGAVEASPTKPLGRPPASVAGHQLVHRKDGLTASHPREAQGHRAEPEADQAPTERRRVVVLALGDRHREQVDLAAVEPDPLVEPSHLLALGLRVRQEDLGRARFENDAATGRPDHVGQALADEHHGRVLLPERPEPLLDLLAEDAVERN